MLLARPRVTWHGNPIEFGAHFSKDIDERATSYTIRGSAGNIGGMLAVLAERVQSMDVERPTLNLFQTDFVPFIAAAEGRPEARASRAFWGALYGAHRYGRLVTSGDLAAVDMGAVDGWIKQTHVPQNAALVIVGEVSPEEVERLAREQFEGWSSKGPGQAPPSPPALPTERPAKPTFIVTPRPGATQGQVRFGCLLPAAMSRTGARYDVAAALAEDHLTRRVRLSLGATYGFHARADILRGGAAHFILSGDVDNAHLTKALETLKAALASFEQGQLGKGELDRARLRIARRYAVSYVTSGDLVDALLEARNEDRDAASIDAYPEEIAATSAEHLAETFRSCAAGSPTLSIVGDEAAIQAAIRQVF
jgi:zinc protease